MQRDFRREAPETGKSSDRNVLRYKFKNGVNTFDLNLQTKQSSICMIELHKNDQQTTCNLSIETKAGVGYNKIKQKRTPPKQKAEGDAKIQPPSVVGKELDPDGKD